VTVLTNAPVSGKAAPLEAILGPTGLIDEVIHYPVGLRDAREVLRLLARLRAGKFDLAISLAAARGRAASWRDTLFLKAAGISKIIGVPFEHRDLVCVPRSGSDLFESEAERLLRRISILGRVDLTECKWLDLRLTAPEKEAASQLLLDHHLPEKFIAASVGTKTELNDWGLANWTQFLAQLRARHPELGVVLLGSADESARSDELLRHWPGARANLCGLTSPRISAAVLERAAVFVGHDSGPMHLAAASGTRCVAIFSARCPPGQWFPVGAGHAPLYPLAFHDPARVNDPDHQRRALASIQVSDVLGAVEKIMADSP
jgi:ADP-heptose:LPS heptosyltransferase